LEEEAEAQRDNFLESQLAKDWGVEFAEKYERREGQPLNRALGRDR